MLIRKRARILRGCMCGSSMAVQLLSQEAVQNAQTTSTTAPRDGLDPTAWPLESSHSGSRTSGRDANVESELKCLCSRTFTRKADLRRHIQSKHERQRKYLCPAKGCFKKRNRTSFARRDKLTDHIRAVHDDQTPCQCPDQECRGPDLSLGELGLHHYLSHAANSLGPRGREDIDTRMSCSGLYTDEGIWRDRCPIATCKKFAHASGAGQFFQHILGHGKQDIIEAQEKLICMNLVPVQSLCNHIRTASGPIDCSCDIDKIAFKCPVCGSIDLSDGFAEHIVAAHLIKGTQQAHFEAWVGYMRSINMQYSPERDLWILPDELRSTAPFRIQCPFCNRAGSSTWYTRHHLDMVRRDVSDLKPYRVALGKLVPHITWHKKWSPLWEDLARPLLSDDADDVEP